MFNKEKVLKILNNKGWSKYKLAKTAGIPQSSLHDILSGKIKNPTAERLKSIADALGVSVNEFFTEKDTTSKEKKPIDKINKMVEENGINTIAAHFEGEEFTEDDLEDIENFIKFIISKKKNK